MLSALDTNFYENSENTIELSADILGNISERSEEFEKPFNVENSISDNQTFGQTDSKDDKTIFLNTNSYIQKTKKEKELQWWLGEVTEIKDDHFKAILEDLNGRTNIVEFFNDFVSPNELSQLNIGARFTYSVSSIDTIAGNREYKTKLSFNFRRRWSKKYDKEAQMVAEELFPADLLDL